jgi:hypothetical protein
MEFLKQRWAAMNKFLVVACSAVLALMVVNSDIVTGKSSNGMTVSQLGKGKAPVGKGKAPPPVVTKG